MYGHFVKTSAPIFSCATWFLVYLVFLLGMYLAYLTCFKGFPLVVRAPYNGFPSSLIAASSTLIVPEILDLLLHSCNCFLSKVGAFVHSILQFYGTITLELFATQQDVRRLLEPLFYEKQPLFRNITMLIVQTVVAYTEHRLIEKFWILVSTVRKHQNQLLKSDSS